MMKGVSSVVIESPSLDPDVRLMLQVREGDETSFSVLVQKHRNAVVHFLHRMVQEQAVAEELAQEVFFRVYRSRESYEATAKFTTWMYRVALNVAISHARSAKHSGAGHLEPLDDVHLETVAGEGSAHHEALERDERLAALQELVARLDALNRALVLLYLEDRSYAEIADVLGISETNVATKLNRIRQKLREQVSDAETTGVKNGTR